MKGDRTGDRRNDEKLLDRKICQESEVWVGNVSSREKRKDGTRPCGGDEGDNLETWGARESGGWCLHTRDGFGKLSEAP